LYVDAGSSRVAARAIRIDTTSPGWGVQIYASNTQPNLDMFSGWTLVGSASTVNKKQNILLNTGGMRYRWYLVWITSLPPGGQTAYINEATLYAYK
jgi:serine/threonine-protein kinase